MMEKLWTKHVSDGNPKEVVVPNISLNQMLHESVEKYADYTAMTFYDKTYTYKEFDTMVKAFAASLTDKGITKGDRVAIMLPNCPQYPISYYSIIRCGAIVVQVNPMYQQEELLHVLKDADVKVLIILDDLLPVVENIKEKTSLTSIIDVSLKEDSKFSRLLLNKDIALRQVNIDPKEDVAVIQYTGGTTGDSKGAMLTHYNLVANTIQSFATAKVKYELGKEKALTVAPLFHVYGMTSCMNMLFYMGGNMIILPRFNVEETVETIEKERPTLFAGVPTMFIGLLNYYKKRPFDLSSLKTCSSGSAPLPKEILEAFNKISGAKIVEGFGLSEASPVTHRNPIVGLQKIGSVGIPVPNTDSKIVNVENKEEELPIGEVGELAVKGPQIMKGYWNLPEETEDTLRDGWLYTGDLAFMDEDGYFTIVGRKKEMIIASGFNVYPVEIEDVLYEHPDVLEAAVIGVPDEYRGEAIKAVVVLQEKSQLSIEDMIDYCAKKLAAYKVPNEVQFVKELPKSAIGKILKRKLIEQHHNQSIV